MKGLNERQLAQVDRLYVDAIRNMRDVLNESLGRLARLESALGMKKCAWCSRWVAAKLETGGQEVPRPGVTLTELMIWQRCDEGQRPKNYLCPTCVAAVGGIGEAREAVNDKAYDDFDAGSLKGWKDAEREATEAVGGGYPSTDAEPAHGLKSGDTLTVETVFPPRRKKGKGDKA